MEQLARSANHRPQNIRKMATRRAVQPAHNISHECQRIPEVAARKSGTRKRLEQPHESTATCHDQLVAV